MEDEDVMALIIKPTNLTPTDFLASTVSMCVLTALAIAVRFWSNYSHASKVFVDDYLCIVALIFMVWTAVIFYLLLSVLNSDPKKVDLTYLTTLCAVGIFAANCALYTAKLPLIFLFIRTFGIKRWLQITCKILVVLGFMGFMATAIYPTVRCSPQLHTVSPTFLITCITSIADVTIPRGSISITIDVLLFVLPLPIIQTLKLPFRKKLGLVLVFIAGVLAIVASALGLYFSSMKKGDTASNIANALLVSVIESSIVVLVSCTPAFHLFWGMQTGSTSRIGTSNQGTNVTSSRLGLSVRSSKRQEDFSTPGSIQATAHHYIELRDMPGANGPRSVVQVTAARMEP
uniref:Rhodopsin domain-containing protein n=1 Tax=Bionectria ochroleuca TaxID=29856 RepID=A0A8H7TV28_BIOOC